ncbi:hypothetical protein CDD83_6298 [Cordyceps sp. RAO-2017]|nr:hypothetical protein CDD83_6298 [Cordyceps sp. RAO-2017]
MTEAVLAFTRWALATWPRLHRLEAATLEGNARSARLLRRCGFVCEGTRRGAAEKDGRLMDELMFGLTRRDAEEFDARGGLLLDDGDGGTPG